MILTCPSCTMRYIVADGAVGAQGRRVRCAHCGHQWFQDAETGLDEELFAVDRDMDIDFDSDDTENPISDDFHSILQKEIETVSIPEGVRPIRHDDLVIPPSTKKKIGVKLKLPAMDRTLGFATAGLVYVIVLGVLLILQPQISKAWPPSNMLYGLMGLAPSLPGEGLAFENLQAKLKDGKIVLAGDILNLKSRELTLPSIMATIVDKDGASIEQVLIPAPADKIASESRLSFDAVYPSLPGGARDVTYAFSFLKAKAPDTDVEKDAAKEPAPETPPQEPHADSAVEKDHSAH